MTDDNLRSLADRRDARIRAIREAMNSDSALVRLRAATSSAAFLAHSVSPDPIVRIVRHLHGDETATDDSALDAAGEYLDAMLATPNHQRARVPLTYLIAAAASPSVQTHDYDVQFVLDHGETIWEWRARYLSGPGEE